MRLLDTLSMSLVGITLRPARSLLTALGIIIGVAAVVLMSSVGESMEGVILGQISTLGPKSMVIFPGQQEGGPNAVATGHDSLTFEDLRELERLPSIESIAPVIFLPSIVSYGSEEGSPTVLGVRPTFFRNQKITVERGRLIEESDDEGAKAVALIGPDAAEEFFGSQDPLGKRLKIGSRHYSVVGVTRRIGSQFFQNVDDRIYVPFSIARDVTGQKYVNYLTMLATDSFDRAFLDVKGLLRRRHGITNPLDDPEKDDFVVRSSAQANQILGSVSLGLTFFITTVAGISLVVGGIGIMNIMLVTVTERIQEIGLRKAVGARRRDILLQFLIEAVALTLVGGAIGVLFGILSAFIIAGIVARFLSTYVVAISTGSVVISFVVAVVTGLVFGLSPALRAARLHPIEALRYE